MEFFDILVIKPIIGFKPKLKGLIKIKAIRFRNWQSRNFGQVPKPMGIDIFKYIYISTLLTPMVFL